MGYKDLKFEPGTVFLVTGGAGFIGSNVCEAILDMGYKVVCADDLSNGFQKNVDLFLSNPNYSFYEGDIRDAAFCKKICTGVDYVLHQAAWGSVPRSIELPLLYEEINTLGTLNMLEAARQNEVKCFVYASSSAVYGDDPNFPKKEDAVGNMLSPYAVTKMTNELFAKQYSMHYGLKTCGLRYFNVFGKRQDAEGAYVAVIPKFIKILLSGKAPEIYGDGLQTRDFTYIENVIEANLKACLLHDAHSGEVFNIAFGEYDRLIDVYENICEALQIDIKPIYNPPRQGDILHSSADISKAQTLLNYAPDWSFKKGIKEAIAWYKENL